MHRLLLRPAARAIRAQNAASSSRNVIRAISTTPCSNFGATGSVSKAKKTDNIEAAFFDALLGGNSEAGALPAAEVGAEKTPEKFPESSPTKEPKMKASAARPFEPASLAWAPTETAPIPDIFGADSESPFTSDYVTRFIPEEYFEEWLSDNARFALESTGTTQIDYISSLLDTDATVNTLGTMTMQEAMEFERLVALYERGMAEDPQAVVPVLSFLLRHGVELRPPTDDALEPEENVKTIDPKIVRRAFNAIDKAAWKIVDDTKVPGAVIPYPDLSTPDPLLDPRDEVEFPPEPDNPFTNRVIVRNHRSVFHEYDPELVEDDLVQEDELETDEATQDSDNMMKALTVSSLYYRNLHQAILMRRGVVQQTGKGKIRRVAFMVLVGDGNGLVGYGEGKHANGATALKAARLAAVRNMDWVERFEKRTIWTEMSTKLGATQVIMRPRPVGFGLRCNPYLHQILRAAGFKDISAKVWGSRNRLNVIKAAFRMLHAGHAPTGMGDGVGGKGKKLSKGVGVKGKTELERARGRKLISLRK